VVKRILVPLVLTIVLLAFARRLSTRRPHDIVIEEAGMTIRHRTVTEQVGEGNPVVSVHLDKVLARKPVIVYKAGVHGDPGEMMMKDAGGGMYEIALPDLGQGRRCYYALAIETATGETVRIPEGPDDFFLIKYKGHVSDIVLVLHIIFMFGAFFFMIKSLSGAVGILRNNETKRETIHALRWCLVTTFIGGWPLGFVLNYQAFGVVWEGFPFGYDVTDNKTQIMFVFWLVTALLVRGSFFRSDERSDSLGPRAFALLVVLSFLVSLGLFILPHSL
jgi:hypothetical protein